jgi:hypothetical protein
VGKASLSLVLSMVGCADELAVGADGLWVDTGAGDAARATRRARPMARGRVTPSTLRGLSPTRA